MSGTSHGLPFFPFRFDWSGHNFCSVHSKKEADADVSDTARLEHLKFCASVSCLMGCQCAEAESIQ